MKMDRNRYRINYENEEINNKFNSTMKNFNKKNYSPNPIKEPKRGISRDSIFNIDESLFLNLQCGICGNLLWNPMMCNDCGNSFCEYCIKKNLTIGVNKSCPMCRSKQFNPGKAKVLNKFFGRVKIRCNNKQCKEKPEYFNYIKHLEECPFRLYHCTNEGCKYEDTLDNIKHHSSECPNRIIKCKFCSKEIKEYTFKTHEKTECTQNVECGECHTSMTRGFYWKNHYSENDENIECLKARNDWKGNEIKKLNEKIEEIKIAHQKEIEKYKNQISALDNEKKKINKENDKLKKELKDWNSSFTNIYDKLVLKKNSIYEEEEEKKYNTYNTDNFSNENNINHLQMTPRYKKINFKNKYG